MSSILSINISEKKGTVKRPVPNARLVKGLGIEGDAHSGDWHRQVSLLSQSSVDRMRAMGAEGLTPGIFAENITVEGMEVHTLPVGTRVRLGECLVEVTQIGKECHRHCEIFKKVGNCVMPKEGIFTVVVEEGLISVGDAVELV